MEKLNIVNMKVKIQQRSVYHKFAEVEVEVPNNLTADQVVEYLWDNEDIYVDELDIAIDEADYEYGNGTNNHKGMNQPESDSEWRFECDELKIGGHL